MRPIMEWIWTSLYIYNYIILRVQGTEYSLVFNLLGRENIFYKKNKKFIKIEKTLKRG